MSDFLKIEKAWNTFLKRASKKRVSSKYVYGEFRKIGVKIFLQCLHKPRERRGIDVWFVKVWKIKNKKTEFHCAH